MAMDERETAVKRRQGRKRMEEEGELYIHIRAGRERRTHLKTPYKLRIEQRKVLSQKKSRLDL